MGLDLHLHAHHRDLTNGAARAATFGVSDGLVSNLALICGVAGAGASPSAVLIGGVAGLLAGAASMASGEYVSMRAQAELIEAELAKEAAELARNPAGEHQELTDILEGRGVHPDRAGDIAADLMATPEMALETHAREELGVDPNSLGSPVGAAAASFAAFAAGAAIPLIPWVVGSGTAAVVASLLLGLVAAVVVGAALAHLGSRPAARPITRQVCALVLAVSVTAVIGAALGSALE